MRIPVTARGVSGIHQQERSARCSG